jgi:hypothetical protein
MWQWCCFLLTLTLSVQVELNSGAAVRLTYMLQSLRVLKDVPAATAEDVDQYYAAQLAEGAPQCPTRTPFWSCNEQGQIDEVTVRGDGSAAPVDFLLMSAGAYFPNTSWVLSDFVGSFVDFAYYSGARRVVGENLVLLRSSGRGSISTTFPFQARNLTLTNVTATEVAYDDENFKFAHCAFTNVTLRCPVPRFLLPCFNQSTPVCLSTNVTSTAVAPTSLCLRNGDAPCNIICSNTPAPGYDCLKSVGIPLRGTFLLHQGSRRWNSLSQDALTRAQSRLGVSFLGLSIKSRRLTGNCVRG